MLGFLSDGSLKNGRGHLIPKRTVGPFVIIQASQGFDHYSGFCQVMEELGIETFAAKCAVETFVAAIFPGFAGFDPTRDNLLVF